MRVAATAPAKLVLLGEYAVLEGATALVAAVNRRVSAELEPSTSERWRFISDLGSGRQAEVHWNENGWNAAVEDDDDGWLRVPVQVAAAVMDAAGVQPERLPACDVHLHSKALYDADGETKLGLGSSAAVVVALAEALRYGLRVWGLDRSAPVRSEAYRETLALHHEARESRGSGVDVAASFHGGLRTYEMQGGATSLVGLPDGIAFGAVWTGRPASTASFLELVEATRTSRPKQYGACIDALRQAAADGIAACKENDGPAFLEAVRKHLAAEDDLGQLCGLPIVSSAHAELADLAAQDGVAYKPSGAGGGDVGLLFATSDDLLQKSARRVQNGGYRWLDLAIDPEGVSVHRLERQS